MDFIDKCGLSSFQVFVCFIQKYEDAINAKYPLFNGIIIDVVNPITAVKIYNNPLINEDYFQDTPYECHTTLYVVVDNEKLSIQFDENERYALIAHEIGHLCCALYGCNCNGFVGETHADDFACSLGLQSELRSALTKLLGVVHDSNLKSKIVQRINRL